MDQKNMHDVALADNMLMRWNMGLDSSLVSAKEGAMLQKIFIAIIASIPSYDSVLTPPPGRNYPVIFVSKQALFEYLEIDPRRDPGAYRRIAGLFKRLVHIAHIDEESFEGNKGRFKYGNIFMSIAGSSDGHFFEVEINSNYAELLGSIATMGQYTRLLTADVGKLKSKFSIALYRFMMSYSNKTELTFTTRQLKKLFGLGESDYVRKDGTFDRYSFERRTLTPALKEIDEKSDSISIMRQPYGKSRFRYFGKTDTKQYGIVYSIRYIWKNPQELTKEDRKITEIFHEEEFPREVREFDLFGFGKDDK